MAKFKKALALVLSLAMVLTLAPVANVNAASKYKISASKKTIAAGGSYTVTVKGVAKTQYVKVARTSGVTVKYSKKTIKASKKVVGTGKNLKFAVTAPGKEKAYNVTIKAVIYNKKTNKKVKTLSVKTKVKALPVEELALSKVESGTNNANGANIVIAYFNRAVDTISPSDIQIRRVSDDQLFSVDKVVMASDKKSATITLTGTDAAGAGGTTRWLMPNVDYKMTITSGTSVAEKVFFIPAVAADAFVIGVDSDKKTITAQTNTAAGLWNAAATYNIPDSLKVDYNELLGQTVTFKYDKTNTVSTLSYLDGEQVIYGAFKEVVVSASNYYLQDQLTETKYYPQTAASGAIPASRHQDYGAFVAPVAYGALAWGAPATYVYGKLTLNTNGTIKNFIHLSSWSGNIYVGSVNGNSIISKTKQEQSLENCVILKNGKSIAISDIKSDDVVFYNTAAKIAEVYNNVSTGKIEAVYDNAGFKFAGKDRDGSKASYIADGKLSAVTTDYLKALGKEKDVTVIFGRDNVPVYVLGEAAAVTTSTKELVLTAAADGFAQTTSNYIRFKGFNGTAEETIDVNLADIKTWKQWTAIAASTTYNSSNGKFYASDGTSTAAAPDDYTTKTTGEFVGFNGLNSTGGAEANTDIINLSTGLPVGKIVTLTLNDKGVATGVEVKFGTAMTGVNLNGVAGKDFKAGYNTLATYTLPATANVYTINKGPAVTKVAYKDFASLAPNGQFGNLTYYVSGSNISDIVIDNRAGTVFSDDDDGSTTSECVVKDVKYLDNKISSITVINNGKETTYGKFGTDATPASKVTKGAIVSVKVLKDGETVSAVALDITGVTGHQPNLYGVSTTAPGAFYMQNSTAATASLKKFTISETATICKIDSEGAVSTISLSDLKGLAYTKDVKVSTTVAGGDKVDSIVVTNTARTQGWAATLAGLTTARAGTGYTAAVAGAGTVTTTAKYDQMTAAKADLEIVRDDMAADSSVTTAVYNSYWVAGGTNIANAYTPYTVMTTELTRAANYQIVAISAMTGEKQTAGGTTTDAVYAGIKKALPSSIHATMADGSEKDIAVKYAASTASTNPNSVTLAATASVAEATLCWVAVNANLTGASVGGDDSLLIRPIAGTGTGTPIYAFTTGLAVAATNGAVGDLDATVTLN